jgi:dihydrolipoamide dehydrogenase
VTGGAVIIAAGLGSPHHSGFDVDGTIVMTSDECSPCPMPGTAVIGGGAIGCEFASMMSDLGAQVTVLEALPDPARLRQGRGPRWSTLLQEAG